MNRRAYLRRLAAAVVTAAATAMLVMPSGTAGAQYAIPPSAEAVPRMSMADFKARVDAGTVVVVDVRSLADYRLGHIPGAVSMPLNEVPARLGELKGGGKPIVTYCT